MSKNISNFSVYTDIKIFDLHDVVIQPGAYFILRSRIVPFFSNGSQIIYIQDGSGYIPAWDANGFAELLLNGTTADFVRFGNDTVNPVTLSEWNIGSAPPFPNLSVQDMGKSLARDANNADTDTVNDWAIKDFATCGGPNDILSFTDNDADGIPDDCEAFGKTYAGLPLYEWGARVNQKDIFVHIDYMDSEDPGVKPRREALDKICQAFSRRGYAVHFDAGSLFGSGAGDYNLDNRDHQAPFSAGVNFNGSEGCANFYWYKNNYLPAAKRNIFYYCLMGFTLKSDGTSRYSGIGEVNGNYA